MRRTGGGTFDPTDPPTYFLATGPSFLEPAIDCHPNILMAVNEAGLWDDVTMLRSLGAAGKKVFLDSGIYNLTMEHARAHDLSMDQALALPPDQLAGFEDLFAWYVKVVQACEDTCWGYVELDAGGRDQKVKTRERLEALGLSPIPVYHPLNDGWEYFDYLAQRYDRICFGNVVQADPDTRRKLVATCWERHRKYPHLWIHLLGYTPNHALHAFPVNSADSSTWLGAVRWGEYGEQANGMPFSKLPRGFKTAPGAQRHDPAGGFKAARLTAKQAAMNQRGWRRYLSDLRALGFAPYPEVSDARP
jgi:hypothetical protein